MKHGLTLVLVKKGPIEQVNRNSSNGKGETRSHVFQHLSTLTHKENFYAKKVREKIQ